MYHITIIAWFATFFSCGTNPNSISITSSPIMQNESNKVKTGADQLDKYLPLLIDKKVACIVNQTSMIANTHIVDSLLKKGISITKIFAPEHGFRGIADAGEKVNNEFDSKTGLPIISMYGNKKKPSKEDLEGIDVVLFDIQDVGVRFYTYISTLHYVMEACGENNKRLIVLDRPNPHAHYIDGPVLDTKYNSFIGMHAVPIVYGMTIGEYGLMINGESWLTNKLKCDLTIIQCANYDRNTMYRLPHKPSPNLPNQNAVLLYPSICLFEGTTLSLGRGTSMQFQVIGHPILKTNFEFIPMPNEGAKQPLHNGIKCFGEDLSEINELSQFNRKSIDLSYIIKYAKTFSQKNEKYFLDNLFFDKLAGTDALRKQIAADNTEQEIRNTWQPALAAFQKIRQKYLIYK